MFPSYKFLLLALGILSFAPGLQSQPQQQFKLIQPVTISVGGQDVSLAAGQTVMVLGVSAGKATIRTELPNGSMGITQISADLLHQEPAAEPAKPVATPQPKPAVTPVASPSPAVNLAKPAPASQQKTSPPPPASQFSLNPGTAANKTSRDGSKTVHKDWKLVWSDEFNGSAIDSSKWNFEVNGDGGGNNELQYYTDRAENAHLAAGNLVITAIKEKYKNRNYTSARMTTKGKFSFKYGRAEARIKFPKGKGMWPAFWMMPEEAVYGGWARSGEIDIAEVVGDKPTTIFGTLHYGDKWPKNTHTGDKTTLLSGDVSSDFHVIALEWEEGEIRWYLDGQLYQTQTHWFTAGSDKFPAPFDQKFFLIFNVAVGGAWPGPPSPETVFPQAMEVDYVRAYQP